MQFVGIAELATDDGIFLRYYSGFPGIRFFPADPQGIEAHEMLDSARSSSWTLIRKGRVWAHHDLELAQ